MELGHVPTASIVGMVITLIISMVLPIVLLIIARVKYKAKISSLFIGAGVFVLFALVLEQILHLIVIGAVGQDKLVSNIWLYGLYGAAAAAVFEETGRFVAFKFFMKNRRDRENAFMYGIGHGGIEAIIIVGITSINNIVNSIMINNGGIVPVLSLLPEEIKEQTFAQISQLWTLPSYSFYMGGIERISAIALHIGMTFVMYKGVKFADKKMIALAFAIHFVADFATVILNNYLPMYVLEVILAVFVACVCVLAYKINASEEVIDD